MTWAWLIDKFLEQNRLLGYAESTLGAQRRWLKMFARQSRTTHPGAATWRHLAGFREKLEWSRGHHGELYAANTIHQALNMVRAFFRWAVREGHLLTDPSRKLVLCAPPQPPRRILSEEEMRLLLATPNPNTLKGQRDRAVLDMLYSTGIRRQECCGLDLDDVCLGQCAIKVRGKGKTERLVPIADGLLDTLEAYLKNTRPELYRRRPSEALFLQTHYSARLSINTVGVVVRDYGRQAGLGRVTPHMLRHACAVHLMENGADLRAIAELLGHRRLASTQVYTRLRPLELKREYERLHPRAKRQPSAQL